MYLFLGQVSVIPSILIEIPQSVLSGEVRVVMKSGVHD